jgi:hypothetical protein
MKIKTIKQFTEQSHINAQLIRSVIRQSGGFDSFKEDAQDITNHGVAGGFSGWIYYTETVGFWRKNKALIIELATDQAADFGEELLAMVSSFNAIKSDYNSTEIGAALFGRYNDDFTCIYNVMAWYALEEVARNYCDLLEA